MDFKVKIKPKIMHKKIPTPSDWYCNICEKKYVKGGKYQHLKTDFHKLNEAKKGPQQPTPPAKPQPRRTMNPEDYVENRLIQSIAERRLRDSYLGGTLIDDPISPSINLPEPLRPTKYKPVPKPHTKNHQPHLLLQCLYRGG